MKQHSKGRLLAEFVALFLILPLGIAVILPPSWMFPALFVGTAVGVVLLAMTPEFRWRSLFAGMLDVSWSLIGAVGAFTFVISYVVMQATAPGDLFRLLTQPLPRAVGGWPIMLVIAVFYPWVSALPQELVFRPLFFRRYGGLFRWGGLWINAAVFSLAHLMYWSWIVAVITFAGGLVFAWSYERRGNFAEAVLAHSVAGVVLFAVGMGTYFYSGNVVRPF